MKIETFEDLAELIEFLLNEAIELKNTEPAIVKCFIDNLESKVQQRIRITDKNKSSLVKIRAKCIHKRPLIIFPYAPYKSPCGVSRMELGDILFRVKIKEFKHNSTIEFDKISIAQAKLSKDQSRKNTTSSKITWFIPKHQHEFLSNPARYPFEFGRKYNISRVWRIKPTSRWLFQYLLMSKQVVILSYSYNPKKIISKSCKDVRLKMDRPPLYFIEPFSKRRFPLFRFFLLKFLKGQIGDTITKNLILKELVDKLYEFVKLAPDPIEDFLGYTTDGVFAIVEITVITEYM